MLGDEAVDDVIRADRGRQHVEGVGLGLQRVGARLDAREKFERQIPMCRAEHLVPLVEERHVEMRAQLTACVLPRGL